jgi:hypothetical protein
MGFARSVKERLSRILIRLATFQGIEAHALGAMVGLAALIGPLVEKATRGIVRAGHGSKPAGSNAGKLKQYSIFPVLALHVMIPPKCDALYYTSIT